MQMAKMRDGLRDKADISVNVVPLFSKIEDGTSIAEDFAARAVVGDNAKSELRYGFLRSSDIRGISEGP